MDLERFKPLSGEGKFSRRSALGLGMLTLLLGNSRGASADEAATDLPPEALSVFGKLDRALKDFDGYLTATEFNRPAILGTNYFAVSMAGIDAIKDLEEGRGVDPETLGGLYAGFAIPEVARHLNLTRDVGPTGEARLRITAPDGRLRYKGTVVRLYPPDKLRELFARRDGFRIEETRKRTSFFSQYVYRRHQELGQSKAGSDAGEVEELSERYRQLQPVIGDCEIALRAATAVSSLLPESGQHFFGYSVGGIDAVTDLNQNHAVDPETMAAIYADRLAPEFADGFDFSADGRIRYKDQEVKMYSMSQLEKCFKQRERLVQKSQR